MVLGAESPTILVVDDSKASLVLYRTSLEKAGFTVLEAAYSDDALTLCKSHPGPIHLVVTDVLLPPKLLQLKGSHAPPTGLELMEQILRVRPEIRVIVMSAHSDELLNRLGLSRMRATAFLRKPFAPEMLVKTVKEVLAS